METQNLIQKRQLILDNCATMIAQKFYGLDSIYSITQADMFYREYLDFKVQADLREKESTLSIWVKIRDVVPEPYLMPSDGKFEHSRVFPILGEFPVRELVRDEEEDLVNENPRVDVSLCLDWLEQQR